MRGGERDHLNKHAPDPHMSWEDRHTHTHTQHNRRGIYCCHSLAVSTRAPRLRLTSLLTACPVAWRCKGEQDTWGGQDTWDELHSTASSHHPTRSVNNKRMLKLSIVQIYLPGCTKEWIEVD